MINILSLSIYLLIHPVHVTMTSIDHIAGTDSVMVFVKMYYDDFLLDYRLFDSNNENTAGLTTGQLIAEDLMNNYINEKVTIIVNNKELKGKLLKLELDDIEVKLNLLYTAPRKRRVVTVRNTIMTDLYSDQSNMVIVRVNDFEVGIKLTPERTEQTFYLKKMKQRERER